MLLIELLFDFSQAARFYIGINVHVSLWLAIFVFFIFRFSKGLVLKKRTQVPGFLTRDSFNNTNGIQYFIKVNVGIYDYYNSYGCSQQYFGSVNVGIYDYYNSYGCLFREIILHSDTAIFEIW